MSNITVTNLPVLTSLSGTAQLMVVQNGVSSSATAQQIANLNANGGTVTSITAVAPLSGGTITSSGSIGLNSNSISNTYLSTMPANTIKGNNSGSAAQPQDLTVAQTMSLLGAAPLNSPAFTGTPTAPTPVSSDNSTTLATTAFVKSQSYGTGTVTSITAGTGLSGGTITSSGTIAIANTGVNAQSYGSASVVPQITVNAQGQITSATNVSISITPSQVSGLGTMATQNANAVAITGGTINGTTIGATTPAAASFTALTATGATNLTTIASGTWNGSTIGIAYGGTGATTASGARSALGAAASGANSDITSLSGLTTPLSETQGGTGYGSYTTGDLLYASSSSTLARLNDVATGNALISGGVGVAPTYGKIGLTTHVSGTLPVSSGGTGATTLTGYLIGNGTSAVTAVSTIPNAGLTNSSITIGSTSIALGATAATLSGLTTVTVTQDPVSALQLSTKQYVDGQVSSVSNTTFHTAVGYATTADLGTVTYNNGTAGVGATITNAGTQAALVIDGYTFTATDVTNATRVMVKNQSSGLQNGIYVVTNQGSGSTNWILTRSTDFNTVGTGPNFIETGAAAFVSNGTANGSTSWVMNTTGTITVGSTALVWVQASSSGNITVSAPITKTGNTIGLGTVGVANGGTGLTSLTAYGVLYAPTTSSVGQISPSTTGYALVSTGASSAPIFSQISLTAGVTGTLPVGNGGTGTSTAFTTGSIVFAGASGVYSQNNAKYFWDNTNFRLGLNTASPTTTLTVVSATQSTTPSGTLPAGTDLYIVGANAANTRITQDAYGTGAYGVFTARQARGTAASPTASQSGDFLAQFTARGYGATGFGTASTGHLALVAAENFTDTAQGTQAGIYTTPTGSNSIVESLRIGPAGQIGVGQGAISYGTSGYVLTSAGASASPTWSQVSLTASVTGTLPAANGGTGQSSYAVGDILYASGTTTLSRLADVATGNVLLSGGVGVAPSWGQVSLTTTVTGILPAANGGTGNASYTIGDILYASSSTALSRLADVAVGSALISGGVGSPPTWGQVSLTTGVTGTLPILNGGTGQTTASAAFNALSPITTTGDLIIGTGTNTAGRLAIGTNGYVLTSNGTTATWAASTGGVTSFSAGTTGFTPSTGTTGAITLSGTLNVANGGTGLSTTPANGALLIGNGTNYTSATLTAGSNVTITNGAGSISIAASAGATGGGTDQIFWNNGQTVTTSYSIPASTNAGTFGPVSISSSATVTIPSSSTWTVV